MEFVENFRDLEVYKFSRKLAKEIYEISKRFPREEMYSLTDQVRMASRSIGAQIAEAWGKRTYEKHFVSKLTDADGEQNRIIEKAEHRNKVGNQVNRADGIGDNNEGPQARDAREPYDNVEYLQPRIASLFQ